MSSLLNVTQLTAQDWKSIAQRHAWMYKSFPDNRNKMRESFDAASAYFAYVITTAGEKVSGDYSDLGDLSDLMAKAVNVSPENTVSKDWAGIRHVLSQWRYADRPQPYGGYDAEPIMSVGDKAIWLVEEGLK